MLRLPIRKLTLLLLGLVLSAGTITATSTAASAATPTPAAVALSVLQAMNTSRARAGLPPLKSNAVLVRTAHSHSLKMAAHNAMTHQFYGELTLGGRITSQIIVPHVRWVYAAENIGWSSRMDTVGALGIEAMMMAEKAPYDGHKRNILSRSVTQVGIDVVFDTVHHRIWLTEDFAKFNNG